MTTESSPDDVRVSGLFSYPIKSCAGISHETAVLETTGLAHDREWMLVDTRYSPARFITQREQPLLATVRVDLDAMGSLVLSSSGAETLHVSRPNDARSLIRVKVWSSEVFGITVNEVAAAWFAKILGMSASHLALVFFHREYPRVCNAKFAGDSGAQTFFADGYPVLVTNQASLDDLNTRMRRTDENKLPMNRFRPNIVLSRLDAWDEDHIDTLTIDGAVIKLVKPCVRCEITTTDQTSGSKLSDEPLNTLARFRSNPDVGGVTFGWNAVVSHGGRLSRNQRVTINYRF